MQYQSPNTDFVPLSTVVSLFHRRETLFLELALQIAKSLPSYPVFSIDQIFINTHCDPVKIKIEPPHPGAPPTDDPIWALGLLFYYILTGKEFNHHLPDDVTTTLSDCIRSHRSLYYIFIKLLAKTPHDRYYSVAGIIADFERCFTEINAMGQCSLFFPGSQDYPNRIDIGHYVYGRDKEIERITHFIDHIYEGGRGLFFIKGYSGVGKTSLIKKVFHDYRPDLTPLVIEGKYDQFSQNPNSGIYIALQQIIPHLLQSPILLTQWNTKLRKGLGHNLSIIIDIIPELEKIVGAIPHHLDDTAVQSTQRFYKAFEQLISVLASKDHPLILFLDDIHWIDQSSIDLLQYLTTHCHIPYFGIISAYRDNECGPDHRLHQWMSETTHISELHLEGLSYEDITDQLQDILHDDDHQIEILSKLIYDKTLGNPFFIRQLIEKLYENTILFYDTDIHQWRWDSQKIHTHIFSDNVGELVADRVKLLSPCSLQILSFAAAFGSAFTPLELQVITGQQDINILLSLREAEQKRFVSRNDGSHYACEEYRFQHDRIQKAAYDLLPTQHLPHTHFLIATRLNEYCADDTDLQKHYLFAIVGNYIKSKDLIISEDVRINVSTLALMAGKISKNMGGYSQALEYIQFGISLLTESLQIQHRILYKDLLKHLSECEYLSNHLDFGELYFLQALSQAQGKAERADVIGIKFTTLCHLNLQPLAVKQGGLYLTEFDISFSKSHSLHVIKSVLILFKLIVTFYRVPLAHFKDSQETNSESKHFIDMLFRFATCAYFVDHGIFAYTICKLINESLNNKFTSYLSPSLAGLGIMLVKVNQTGLAIRLGQFGLQLCREESNFPALGKTLFLYGAFLNYWHAPLDSCLSYLEEAHSLCSDFGETSFANFAANNIIAFKHFQGLPLKEILNDLSIKIKKTTKDNDQSGIIYNSIMTFFITQTLSESPVLSANYTDHLTETDLQDNILNQFFFSVYHTQYLYIMGFPNHITATQFKTHSRYGTAMLHFQEYQFYYALHLSRILIQQKGIRLSNRLHFLKLCRTFKRYSTHCPDNFKHKYLFLTAEKCRIRRQYKKALLTYDMAYTDAMANRFLLNAALIKEEAGKCARVALNEAEAKYHIQTAISLYDTWGCPYKVNTLKKDFGI